MNFGLCLLPKIDSSETGGVAWDEVLLECRGVYLYMYVVAPSSSFKLRNCDCELQKMLRVPSSVYNWHQLTLSSGVSLMVKYVASSS